MMDTATFSDDLTYISAATGPYRITTRVGAQKDRIRKSKEDWLIWVGNEGYGHILFEWTNARLVDFALGTEWVTNDGINFKVKHPKTRSFIDTGRHFNSIPSHVITALRHLMKKGDVADNPRRTRYNGRSDCPYCGGLLEYHGSLGDRRHFRCRNCGQWVSKTVKRRKKPVRRNSRRHGGRSLSVPERHQLKIARQTLKMHDAAVHFMGGPNKAEAREIIYRLTGKRAKENPRYRKNRRGRRARR